MLEKFELPFKDVNGHRLYLTPEEQWVPSVTTILQSTMSPDKAKRLKNWQDKVGFEESEKIRLAAADRGATLHSLIEDYFSTGEIGDENNPYWKSAVQVLNNVSNIQRIESAVWHPYGYAGCVDMVAGWCGELCIIDWKTADKKKYGEFVHDYKVQVSAYCAAVNRVYQSRDIRISKGLIVVAVPELKPQVIPLDVYTLNNCWAEFQSRLRRYNAQFAQMLEEENKCKER